MSPPGENAAANREPTSRARSRRESAFDSIALLGISVALVLVHATGRVGTALYPVIILLGIAGGIIGTLRHQQRMTWPWWCLAASATLWIGSGMIADATASTGDLSASRSLLADVFALPGYVCFGATLHGLARARGVSDDRDTFLDGVMVAAASALLLWETLVVRTFAIENSWTVAQIIVVIYPIGSMCLLALATRLAFASGPRSLSLSFLLLGTGAFLVGDVLFAFGEIGLVEWPETARDIPYLLVPGLFGAALLHPTADHLNQPVEAHRRRSGWWRLAAVAAALLAPIPLMLVHQDDGVPITSLVFVAILSLTGIVRIVAAVRGQMRLTRALYQRATHDELTGLVSRSLLLERADGWLLRGRRVALLFVDLDHFKYVNDSMGHAAGDELLVQISRRITGACPADAVVSRQSGDEFVIAVPDVDTNTTLEIADRIRRTVRQGHQLSVGEAFVASSVGITLSRSRTSSAAQLLQEADTAMYQAKEAGRDTVTMFDDSMQAWVDRRLDLERALRQAMANDEIHVAFQPIHDFRSERIEGAEALARWRRDDVDISPVDFIPIAEDSGLIVPIGAYVLDEACRQAAWWRSHLDGGENMYVSVNVSPRQLRASDFVDLVAETLARHGLPGHALWLELTERVMMDDSVSTLAVLNGLRSIGVRLAVDDFGTGYSSLSYLKRFPIDRVKIDRTFVAGLGTSGSDSSLVEAIVAMARALHLQPVAEGVETEAQAVRLDAAGCSSMQGYLFDRPLTPAGFVDAARRNLATSRSVRWLISERRS